MQRIYYGLGALCASSPLLAETPTMESALPTLLLSLLFVIALIFVIAAVFKRTSLSAMRVNGLKVVTMLPLSTREKIIVVDVDGQQLLLGVTQHNISLLKELDEPLTTPQSNSPLNEGFKKIFEQVKKRD
ncbi:flagellar biosynthetic protein FliO [Algibacillus agarilyticus]|uniref:flagellar biosynthetic protein FliO n=1 Tax=Algibacillus agarilyticus TaxID=2234133 RepID=UPI000DCF7A04|nr:flagellar biosynthetic protein FliO [Algibacillus agarilyticus]